MLGIALCIFFRAVPGLSGEASARQKVILIGVDGLGVDQLLFFSKRGTIPHLTRLIQHGSLAYSQSSTPTDCPTNWTSINTATWSGTNGIDGFYVHRPGEPFEVTQHSTWGSVGMIERPFFWDSLGRAGKKSILVDWPTVAWDRRSAPDTILLGDGGDGKWAMLGPAVYSATKEHLQQAVGWKDLPKSALPPLEWRVARTEGRYYMPTARGVVPLSWAQFVEEEAKNANKFALHVSIRRDLMISSKDAEKYYYFVIYATGRTGYNRVLITKEKNASHPLATLEPGSAPVAVYDEFLLENGQRREGGFYVQVRNLQPQADFVDIFRSDIESDTGWSSPPGLDNVIAHKIGPYLNQESVLVNGGISFTGEPYAARLPWDAMNAKWIARTAEYLARKNPDWALLAVYYDPIDQVDHALMGDSLDHTYPAWQADKHRLALRTMDQAFRILDNMVGEIVSKLGDKDTTVVIVSDHGHVPELRQVALAELLWRAGLISYKWEPPTNDHLGRFLVDWSKTKCIPFYFADNIFINLKGRDPHGIVPPQDYSKVQGQIIQTLESLRDPETGRHVIEAAIRKQDAFSLGHFADDPYAGDVLYFMAPGYTGPSDDSTQLLWPDWGKTSAPAVDPESFFVWTMHGGGWHDSFPGLVYRDDQGNQVSLYSTILMEGRGIREGFRKQHPARLIDVAPMIDFLLGVPPPRDAEGSLILPFLKNPRL